MEQVLIKEEKFNGQYVTIKDISDPIILTHGNDPQKVYEEAVKAGALEPMLFFVPSENMVQIYLSIWSC